jgi:hypothetical protein
MKNAAQPNNQKGKAMKQSVIKSQLLKALVLVLSTVGLMLMLPQSAVAGAKMTHFTSIGTLTQPTTLETVMVDATTLYGFAVETGYSEEATDPRVTGNSVLRFGAVFDLPGSPGPLWGTYHLENADGAWDGYWSGQRTAFSDPDATPHLLTTGVTTAVGSGAYRGLVARWEVTVVDADSGNPTQERGYIIEAKGDPDKCPVEWRSEGTERVETRPGLFITSPEGQGEMVTWDILKEVTLASHLGLGANEGFGLLDPTTGKVTGGGALRSANGDRLYWVATGTSLGPNGPVDLTLHWAGGTGRFEAAVGEIEGILRLHPTKVPSLMRSSLAAEGAIRY